MWKRLAALWATMAVAIYFLFFYRIETHAVILEMPTGDRVDPHQAEITAQWFSVMIPSLMLLAILGICIWLNIRIIRRYRKSS